MSFKHERKLKPMVTRASKPGYEGDFRAQQPPGAVSPGTIAPNSTIPKPLPPIDPMTPVGAHSGVTKSDQAGAAPSGFKLPDRVSASELREQSFKYGPGER
jgi:hypothetical protein